MIAPIRMHIAEFVEKILARDPNPIEPDPSVVDPIQSYEVRISKEQKAP